MKLTTVFVLFISNMATGQQEPIMAFDNSETCWAYASFISADGIDATCYPSQVMTATAERRSPLAPAHSPRPRPRPQEP